MNGSAMKTLPARDDILRVLIRPATIDEVAESTGLERREVAAYLRRLTSAGLAEQHDGRYCLNMQRTAVIDEAVLQAITSQDGITRADLDSIFEGQLTSGQIYSSLTRLILRGQVEKLRNGTRVPWYVALG